MKRTASSAPLWACVASIAFIVISACHSTRPVQKTDRQKPEKQDTTKQIDTGPSEFFDGFIRYKTPKTTVCISSAAVICTEKLLLKKQVA